RRRTTGYAGSTKPSSTRSGRPDGGRSGGKTRSVKSGGVPIGDGRAGASSQPAVSLPQILQIFAGLEADGTTRGDTYFLASPWVTANAALPGLDLKHAEAAKLDPVATLHRQPHGVEHGVHRHLGFHLGDV